MTNKLPPKVPPLDIAAFAPNYPSDAAEMSAFVNAMHIADANTLAVDPYQLMAISSRWDAMNSEQRTEAIRLRKHHAILKWNPRHKAATNIKNRANGA